MLPTISLFSDQEKSLIESLLTSHTSDQRSWLGGFLSGPARAHSMPVAIPSGSTETPLSVYCGTESGNSEALADRAVKAAKKQGFQAKAINLAEVTPGELVKVS